MSWEKDFLKLHYEPEHEKGETCWCEPIKKVKRGVYHIEHQEQRKLLIKFIYERIIRKTANLRRGRKTL